MSEQESLIEDARHTIACYDDMTTVWFMYPPEIVIGALVAEIKEVREALGNGEALHGTARR